MATTQRHSVVTVTDLFCGAGGSSQGVRAAGAEVQIAVNHWRLAVDTHAANFADTEHDCADISACDPRRYRTSTVLIASPECTNHSKARGKKTKHQGQQDMFETPVIDPSVERSRATMWDVVRFAEYHQYAFVIVENVIEVRDWVLYDAWLTAMHNLGYAHKALYFNSMFFHPTPQSRDRIYVVFWRRGNTPPDLDFRPTAYCQSCGQDVQAVQSWKKATTKHGRYGARNQYMYCCPHCGAVVTPYYYCAANAIDWSLPIVRIGDRAAHGLPPLRARTLARIRAGIERFGLPVLHDTAFAYGQGAQGKPVTDPLRTQTTAQSQSIAVPPFLMSVNHSDDRLRSLDQPMPTSMPHTCPSLVVPPFLVSYYGKSQAADIEHAVPTISTRHHHGLVMPPFVLGYYGKRHATTGIEEALPTQAAQPRHAVIAPSETLDVEDCGYRMLQPAEIQRAMAFANEYVVLGSKRDQIKQLGNAVTPPVMEWIFRQCVATLEGEGSGRNYG